MSFVEKLAAVRSELVLPPKEEMAAPVAMDAAMTLMGIVAEETWAPCLPPEGYRLVVQPPPAEALEVKNDTQEILVGMSLLYTAGQASAGVSVSSRRPTRTGATRCRKGWSISGFTTRSTATPHGTCSPSTHTAATVSAHGCSSRRLSECKHVRVSGYWGPIFS